MSLGNSADLQPDPYDLFYVNMNIGSTYFLATCIIILLLLIGWIVGEVAKKKKKMWSYFEFMYNFFVFGFTLGGSLSFQGAFLNSMDELDGNSFFYILGIFFYFLSVFECFYFINKNGYKNISKLRVLTKATLLSVSYYSPVVMVFIVFVIDVALLIV